MKVSVDGCVGGGLAMEGSGRLKLKAWTCGTCFVMSLRDGEKTRGQGGSEDRKETSFSIILDETSRKQKAQTFNIL